MSDDKKSTMNFNKQYDAIFKPSAKAKAFDEIAKLFYDRNFGSATKTEVELLMFSLYMDAMIDKCSNDDKTTGYDDCSDYRMSKDLGITQQRVQTLKEKKQKRYPKEFSWQKSLAELYDKVTYDPKTGYISLYIPDRNLFLEIQNFIEEKEGGFIDIKLNNKILCVRPEYFIKLALSVEGKENEKEVVNNLKEYLHKHSKENMKLDDKNIGEAISKAISCGADIVSILSGFNSILSPTNIYKPMIQKVATEVANFLVK